jgi:hypothetical protein
MVPPLYLMQDGARDYAQFKQNGMDAFRTFLDLGLQPTDRILDIGWRYRMQDRSRFLILLPAAPMKVLIQLTVK